MTTAVLIVAAPLALTFLPLDWGIPLASAAVVAIFIFEHWRDHATQGAACGKNPAVSTPKRGDRSTTRRTPDA